MRNRIGTVLTLLSVAVVAACVDGELSGSSIAGTDAGGDGVTASHAWMLDGDGEALAGDTALTFSGGFEIAEEAVSFDGVTGFASTSQSGPLTTTESFSVAAWVNLAHPADYTTAVSQLGEVAAAFFLGYAEGAWHFGMKDADTNAPGHTIRALSAPAEPDPAAWVYLVGVYDHSMNEIRLYVDGQSAATQGFTTSWQAQGPLTIGGAQAHGVPSDFWPGAIAETRLYPAALDDAQVLQEYENTRPALPPPAMPPAPSGFVCPPHGGACLGLLEAGTYTTEAFSPAITYTVPDGWTNGEDLLGNFLLQLEGDPRYLGIYRNIAAPFECQESPDPNVDQTIEALSDWLTSHPGLETTEPTRISIGGLTGVYIDISLASSWTTTCPYSEGQPVVPFIIGGDPSSLHHVILPGFEERLYLLEYQDGNIAIEVGPEGGSLPDYLEEVVPVIESLQFGECVATPDECTGTAGESDPKLPDGTYTTEELTAEDAVAALRARGVDIDEQMAAAIDSEIGDQTYAVTYVFGGGAFVQRVSTNGGPAEVGSGGTYEVLDDTTLELFETCCGTTMLEFGLDGNTLHLRLGIADDEVQAICDEQPLDCVFLAIFESGPYVREDGA